MVEAWNGEGTRLLVNAYFEPSYDSGRLGVALLMAETL